MSGDNFARSYSVVADTRRRWSEDEKQAIIREALQPAVNVSGAGGLLVGISTPYKKSGLLYEKYSKHFGR